jgi:hypothetical protein
VTGRATVQMPVTLDSANRRKDRSVSLRFSSTQELGTAEFAELDRLTPSQGWLLFSLNEFTEADVPTEDAPSDTKKPSQRVRGILYRIWESNTDMAEDFELYYRRRMERIMLKLKEELS